MKYVIYILRNNYDKLYIGHSSDLSARLNDHSIGKGAEFTRTYKRFKLVYIEHFENQTDAVRREKQLKGWTRAKKEALIAGDIGLLKRL